jgi:hypothetical protein
MSKFRSFEVSPGLSGFKVKIGCSEAYFSTAHELKKAISLYLTNPQAVEESYMKGDLRYGSIPVDPTPITRLEPVDAPLANINVGRPYFQGEEVPQRENTREPNLANNR